MASRSGPWLDTETAAASWLGLETAAASWLGLETAAASWLGLETAAASWLGAAPKRSGLQSLWHRTHQIIRCGCPIHAAPTTWLGHPRLKPGPGRDGERGSWVPGAFRDRRSTSKASRHEGQTPHDRPEHEQQRFVLQLGRAGLVRDRCQAASAMRSQLMPGPVPGGIIAFRMSRTSGLATPRQSGASRPHGSGSPQLDWCWPVTGTLPLGRVGLSGHQHQSTSC